jgi:DNA-binding response OmpR family regulator
MQKSILIIEDDKDTLEILGYLAESLNLAVTLRSDVLTIDEIKAISPDIILLDHWINGRLGGDICNEIKSNSATTHIPVIMVSAHNQVASVANKCKADAYLAKPFNIDDIERIIKRYIDQ